MASAAARVTSPPAEHLLTAADLALLPAELSSGTVRYELENGKLRITPPPGDVHGAVQLNIGSELQRQGVKQGFGKARVEVGVILWRNPDHVFAPDALFVASASLPLRLSPEGYLETIPDLVVEVRSKNETDKKVAAKVRDYLKAGVKVVWLADPQRKTVTAYRRGRRPRVFRESDTLTVDDVIPGSCAPVAGLFEV
jgi:Uma2 family endonuclease